MRVRYLMQPTAQFPTVQQWGEALNTTDYHCWASYPIGFTTWVHLYGFPYVNLADASKGYTIGYAMDVSNLNGFSITTNVANAPNCQYFAIGK